MGFVRKRGKIWYAYWRETDPLTGKRPQRSHAVGPTEKEALVWLARKEVELADDGPLIPSETTIGQEARLWLAGRLRLASSTRRAYEGIIRNRIEPDQPIGFGALRVLDLTTADVRAWIAAFDQAGFASSYISQSYGVLCMTLDAAVLARTIRANPARSPLIELPPERAKRPEVLDDEQLGRFLVGIQGHRHETLFRFLLASQLRIGEALALRWRNVDLAAGSVAVVERWYGETGDVGPPKSAAGERTLRLDDETVRMLRAHRDRATFSHSQRGGGQPGEDLVFPGQRGRHMNATTPRRALHDIQKRHGLPPLTLHALRHTGATMLLRRRVPLYIVSHRLGHANTRVTDNIYAHWLPADDEQVATLIGELLKAPDDTSPRGLPAAGA